MNKYPIRLSIKGVILKEDKMLCLKHEKDGEVYYTLPGGGQEFGETIHQAVKRECLEEANVHVLPHEVMFIRDYIAKNHEFSTGNEEVHQVEIMLKCSLIVESEASLAIQPDDFQIGIEWIPLAQLLSTPLYPQILKEKITNYLKGSNGLIYLGDVN